MSIFKKWFSKDLGIDLGTSNTLVYMRDKGIVVREPSVVAYNDKTKKVLAVGDEANQMIGRTPGNIKAVRPMKDGVIADFQVTENMIRYFINKIKSGSKIFKPRIIICIPSGATEVEHKAVLDAAHEAGAKEAYLIEESMAAAMGVGLAVQNPIGNMIVDIGGGTTEVAVISLGGIVNSRVIRDGGNKMDEAITQYIKEKYNLMIGERTAEELKKEIGTVTLSKAEASKDIRGRNLVKGLPKTIEIQAEELKGPLQKTVNNIINTIKIVLENTPPELSSDIIENGIILTGGGSLLRGIDECINDEVDIPVHLAETPLDSVANGTGIALEEIDLLKETAIYSDR
ncbi:MAG: rod shape-determining protein [Halanaerobiaceae bacterium]